MNHKFSGLIILISALLLQQHVVSCFGAEPTSAAATHSPRPVAIVTGGTRGIGSGISQALADAGFDLLLTYNTNSEAAQEFVASQLGCSGKAVCVGGDIALPETRDKIFASLAQEFPNQRLQVLVHNAGQYVGITSDNASNIQAKSLAFGDGSLLKEKEGTSGVDFTTMNYYQRLYGEAFIDLCERAIVCMAKRDSEDDESPCKGGTIVGISSPGVAASLYGPDSFYSMPGAGKSLIEYSMRIYAKQAAAHNINVNVIVPGVTRTEAWSKLAASRGMPEGGGEIFMQGLVDKRVPMKTTLDPRDIGNVVAFLASPPGRFMTGLVLPVDGGFHLTY